jgi:rhodanese-related sulfurtransferase
MAEDSVQLVDVLPEAEYRQSHIPGAVNIPLRTLAEETTRALGRDKPIAVY